MAKTVVISLGGSIIVSGKIDVGFLKGFKKVITGFVEKGNKAVIVCGGGKTCRRYQDAAAKVSSLRNEDLDWIGIHTTRLNAQLIKTLFLDIVNEKIVHNPNEKIEFKKKVLIASGWKPGFSTDYDAVMLAKNFNVKTVVNMSDIDYVYDKEPKNNSNAKPFKKISWKNFRKIAGDKWDPGLNTPFDPMAAREAEKLKLKVVILKGTDLDNLRNFLDEKEFNGTIIS